jgi:N-acyl-D-amino-acid deacylase
MTRKNRSIADIAAARGVDPVEAMIDLALETDFSQFFLQPITNRDMGHVQAILSHPNTIMTFSDSGAHVSQIMDSSIHSTFLAYWVRERAAFALEDAVRMITRAPAQAWGFQDRGLIREGMIADMNVFDPQSIEPELPEVAHDLPGNGVRLTQRCRGILATVVSGQLLFLDGEHTGALPGRLLRGPLAQ